MPALLSCVLCGGSGSRLWPLSRAQLPKPFVVLPGRRAPLIDDAYARLRGMEAAATLTITASEYNFLCHESHARAGGDAPHVVVGEPRARNTAAAIGVAAATAAARFGEDSILLITPADHHIGDADAFVAAMQQAAAAAARGKIALLGIVPTHAATGYGYIQAAGDAPPMPARRFIEKPNASAAAELIKQPDVFWNAGIFCLSAQTALAQLQKHAPDVFAALPPASAFAESGDILLPAAEYEKIPSISFDFAVAEKTEDAVVVPAPNLQWSDVGEWGSVAAALPAGTNGNRANGDALLLDCENVFVAANGGRLAVVAGMQNAHIIDTPDALLVAPANNAALARRAFEALQQAGRDEAKNAATTRRPWGGYTVLADGAGFKVKRIDVLPGGKLSLQSHQHRSEHWTAVAGEPRVVVDGKDFALPVNESCFIPQGAKHRLYNTKSQTASIIEVQCGSYLGEDDIVRYEDIYGRA